MRYHISDDLINVVNQAWRSDAYGSKAFQVDPKMNNVENLVGGC